MNVLPRLVWLCCWLLSSLPGSASAADRFAIFAPEQKEAEALAEVLGGKPGTDTKVAASVAEALRADADVVVLFRLRSDEPRLESDELQLLKTKKVIGIGWGAAQLFDSVGLQVNTSCVHDNTFGSPRYLVSKSSLVPDAPGGGGPEAAVISAFAPPVDRRNAQTPFEMPFALYLPVFDEKTQEVEAIARWENDRAYAPIARQGNAVLVGIHLSVEGWSPELKTLLRGAAARLAQAPNVPFALPRRALASAGDYVFELHAQRAYPEPNARNFFFRFSKPGTFVAVLEHHGSGAVMLHFGNRKGIKAAREDARKDQGTTGKTLRIEREITQADLDRVGGDDYWKLKVVNFDRARGARCQLRIEVPAE